MNPNDPLNLPMNALPDPIKINTQDQTPLPRPGFYEWGRNFCQNENMRDELIMIGKIIKTMDDYIERTLTPFCKKIRKENLENFNKKYIEYLETYGSEMTEEEEEEYCHTERIEMNKSAAEKVKELLPKLMKSYENLLLDKFNEEKISLYELNLSMDILKKRMESFKSLDSEMLDM